MNAHRQESRTYDSLDCHTAVSDALGQAAQYQYNARNLLSRHRDRMNRATDYSYDVQGRLTTIAHPDGDTLRLTYDAVGRIQSIEDNTSRIDYRYDAADRLIRERTTNAAGSHEVAYTWDSLDRLIQRTVNGGDLTTYRYDLAGGLIDPTYLTGLQIDEMIARHTAAGARTYLTDALGSVIAQTTDDQTPINWYAYSPYGEVDIIGNDEGNPVQYTGRENDGTGLYYYRARYYDPVLKRFISRDPIGLMAGVNFYGYVGGDPVRYTDPEGLWSVSIDLYKGVGGGLRISKHEGTLEITGRIGVGIGGGISYDPDGRPSPHARPCGSGVIARTSLHASALYHDGSVSRGRSITVSTGNAVVDNYGGGYVEASSSEVGGTKGGPPGVKIGVSLGAEVGSYTNW